MAKSSSRMRAGPVSLSEVRHEQRRVAALLNASGQVEVSFPPHESIPVQDLYKSRFYRQLQAAKSLPTRVPPLGNPLVHLPGWKQTDKDNPLVSNQYRHFGNGDDGSVAAFAHTFKSGVQSPPHHIPGGPRSYSRRRAVNLKRKLSKSVPSSLGLDNSKGLIDVERKSLSRYESLPDIGQSTRQKSGDVEDAERSKVEYRLPRCRREELGIVTEGSTGPPHLHYNHGIVDPGRTAPRSISQIFSPTGWLKEDTDIDQGPLQSQNKTGHRKRKHQSLTNPFMRTYDHDEVPFNSPESSTSSVAKPSSSQIDTSSSTTDCGIDDDLCPDGNDHTIGKLVADEQKNVISPSNYNERSASCSDPKQCQPEGPNSSGGLNPNDDPYGTAYIKALSVARSKAMQKDPFYLSQRLTRPFTFSYFCGKEVCTCGNCPKVKPKKGKKSGLKSILGDVNMYDYFKWSKDKTDGKI